MKNTTQLIGYLGADPISKETKNEKMYVTFSLATHDHYKSAKGEKMSKTLWHTIEAYGELAKRVKTFANKGDQVGLTGKLSYNQNKATIIASQVMFLKKGPEGEIDNDVEKEIKEAV